MRSGDEWLATAGDDPALAERALAWRAVYHCCLTASIGTCRGRATLMGSVLVGKPCSSYPKKRPRPVRLVVRQNRGRPLIRPAGHLALATPDRRRRGWPGQG